MSDRQPAPEREAILSDALYFFYCSFLQHLEDERGILNPELLEAFIIRLAADHFMYHVARGDDKAQVKQEVDDYLDRMRQAIAERVDRYQPTQIPF